MKFYNGSVKVNQVKIHFLDNREESDHLIVLFPPGIQDARFVQNLEIPFQSQMPRIVSISYPSRYRSSRFSKFDSLENIAFLLERFLENILSQGSFNRVDLVGFSFGTAVVTILMQKNRRLLFKGNTEVRLFLVNPGEFFDFRTKKILLFIFKPALKSKIYSRLIKFLIVDVSGVFEKRGFPDARLIDIDEQWISTLLYEIDQKRKVSQKAYFFVGSKDAVINHDSLPKLNMVFENAETIIYPGNHLVYYASNPDYIIMKDNLWGLMAP